MEDIWIMIILVFVGTFIKPTMTQSGSEVNLTKFPGEDCTRICTGRSRVCYYNWILEHYHAMGPACRECARGNLQDCVKDQCITGDGTVRGVMSINRQIPGPAMHVCRNDLIVVDVTNMMGGTSSTIHWHGFHQRETPFMDGVPYITQCPISFGTTFRYSFVATESGTQWYHSHTGHHKTNGHYGGLVVRDLVIREPHNKLYDEDRPEHLIVASDWMEDLAEMFDPGLPTHRVGMRPTNLLINGRGVLLNSVTRRATPQLPIEVFRVNKGRRFRFRFVNSASHVCPIMIEIEGHKLRVIASDSYPLNKVDVDAFYTTSGERYDFVIDANQPSDKVNYWVRVRAVGACIAFQIEQYAILSYATTGTKLSLSTPGVFPKYTDDFGRKALLNNAQTVCDQQDDEEYCISDLSAPVDRPDITKRANNEKYFLRFVNIPQNVNTLFQKGNYQHFYATGPLINVGTINNISFTTPSFPLLTQRDQLDDSMFCDQYNKPARCNNSQICNCIHRIKIKLNSIVELIIVDESPAVSVVNHPFHLHGTQMFVMAMGTNPSGAPMTVAIAREMDSDNKFNWIKHNPPVKDTVSIPSKGYTIVRFRADNPGFWFMHCHFEWHMAAGMALVLQIGETSDMKNPPENFPKCNNFKPDIDRDFLSANRITI